ATLTGYGEFVPPNSSDGYSSFKFAFGAVAIGNRAQTGTGALSPWDVTGWDLRSGTPVTSTAWFDAAAAPPTNAAITTPVAYFLHIDGIDGSARDIGHVGWFNLLNYNLSLDAGAAAPGHYPSIITNVGSGASLGKLLAALGGDTRLTGARIDG